MTPNPTVYVVDDDSGVRRSLQAAMESAGYRALAFSSAEDFLDQRDLASPACMILDLRLKGMSGLQLMEQLRLRMRSVSVVMLTGHGDVPAAVQSMKLGAVEFLEKPVDRERILAAVREALRREDNRLTQADEARESALRLSGLTDREAELLRQLMLGKSSKVIGAEMGISTRTVENHRSHLLAKTGAENVAELVRLGVMAGIRPTRP